MLVKSTRNVSRANYSFAARKSACRWLQALSSQLCRIVLGTVTLASVILPAELLANSQSESSAQELIASMSRAMRTLNYEGTYVHFHGKNLTNMHILHASESDREFKRISVLDGEECEITGDNTSLSCIWSSNKSLFVTDSAYLKEQLHQNPALIDSEYYTFSHSKLEKVAGRSAHVVDVESIDDMRYGYRFWIDSANHMLLRSMMFEGEGSPVDQMMFTQISFPEKIDMARFNAANPDTTVDGSDGVGNALAIGNDEVATTPDEVRQNAQSPTNGPVVSKVERKAGRKVEQQAVGQSIVNFNSLPVGYEKVSETLSNMPDSYGPVRHVMFSDGMASVSVYVEYLTDPKSIVGNFVEGLSTLGTTNAYGVRGGSMLITAVGEAPDATVQAFANAVILLE